MIWSQSFIHQGLDSQDYFWKKPVCIETMSQSFIHQGLDSHKLMGALTRTAKDSRNPLFIKV